jgi:hypothetical protein
MLGKRFSQILIHANAISMKQKNSHQASVQQNKDTVNWKKNILKHRKFVLGGLSFAFTLFSGCAALAAPKSMPDLAVPPQLINYDPSGQIRFRTASEADAKRLELISFIWSTGLPTNTLPSVMTNIGSAVFAGNLSGINGSLAASADKLDANIAPYDFHGICYLVHPLAINANNRRLVVVNAGHPRGGKTSAPFSYGVNDIVNRLLSEGFKVLMTDMPLVGFNTHRTVVLPNAGGTVTLSQRETAGHNEMFRKLTPPVLPDGTIFRFFLEPMVQGVNYFLSVTPDVLDVSFVGISGGGWMGHMLAALDTRIKQSFPVAGSYPLYIRHEVQTSDDTEQTYAPLYSEIATKNTNGILDTAAGVASWLEIYALGGYGPGRRQIQILNYYDTCCFFGGAFTTYTNFVSNTVEGLGHGKWDFYSDTSITNHWISSNVINNVIMPGLTGTPATPTKGRAGGDKRSAKKTLPRED